MSDTPPTLGLEITTEPWSSPPLPARRAIMSNLSSRRGEDRNQSVGRTVVASLARHLLCHWCVRDPGSHRARAFAPAVALHRSFPAGFPSRLESPMRLPTRFIPEAHWCWVQSEGIFFQGHLSSRHTVINEPTGRRGDSTGVMRTAEHCPPLFCRLGPLLPNIKLVLVSTY